MMRVSEIIPTLAAVSKLQARGEQSSGMNGSESECESLDSGLETTSNSQLEAEGEGEGGHADPDTEEEEERHGAGDTGDLSDFSEGIYENTPMKSGAMPAPAPSTAPAVLGKYEFGLGQEIRGEDSEQEQEQEQEEEDTRGQEAVSFQDLDNFERVPAGEVKRSWGVRRESSAVSPVERSVNPTEEVIAREIRELKEREEELARRQREQSQEPDTDTEEEEEVREDTSVKTSSSTVNMAEVKTANSSSKFNPSLYGPVILPPRARPGLMQSFLNNGGKVAAFKPPARDTVVTLRKPQVFKAVPKVSPPAAVAAVSRPSQGQVLDKIQAELAETRRREDELRRQRQPRDSGGQHSLDTGDLDTGEGEEEEDSPPSLVCTRGKSALISVWENRIQCEKAA